MICPVEQIQMMAEPLTCDPTPVFKPALYAIPHAFQPLVQMDIVSLLPIQVSRVLRDDSKWV